MLPILRQPGVAVSAALNDVDREPLVEQPTAEAAGSGRLAASSRCLAHCWLDDQQRDQGQRCLVACWQSDYRNVI